MEHLVQPQNIKTFCKAGLTFFLSVIAFNLAFGQVRTVTGIVTAADTKETLPGATVIIKGTTIGTTTNIDGKYTLNIMEPKAVLIFSYLGYSPKEIDIGDRTIIDVVLELKKTTLDEVVVIGYGTVRKSDLTGAVGSVKSEDITKITSINPVQSLQGKVTGVQVTSTSGTPGENPTVRIRGTGTFNNSSPIYVVDGVILDDISFLNSADIASMEVLKDASATAIYGSRGSNGVIIVTTKTGKIGQDKATFSFTGEYGIQRVAKKIDMLNGKEFATIFNEIQPGYYNNLDMVPNTDWQDEIFHLAPVYNFQLSASGATKIMQYYVGVGYFKQKGIIDKSGYERITVKFNNTYHLTSFLRLGNNLTFTPYNQQFAPDVTYMAYRDWPTLVPYYPDGSFAVVGNIGNPLAALEYSNNYRKGIRAVGNLFAEATILKSFVLKSSFGIDAGYNKAQSFTPAYAVLNPDGTISHQNNEYSTLLKDNSDNLTWLWENTLTYKKEIKKHSIDALVGYTMQNTSSEGLKLTGKNIIREGSNFWYLNPNYLLDPANNINTINNNDFKNSVDPNQYYSMISYLFRVNYTYNNRYIFTATFRRDGSSKFAEKNRYSNFPSFAAGWNISQEKFMKDASFISKLKIRASWGKIGNEKIQYDDRYSKVINQIVIFGTTSSANPGATYGKNGNPNLKWEVTTQTDAGLEVGVFNNRLTGEFDYYHRVADDILVQLTTPGYLGNGQGEKVRFNAASALNRGFEFNVTWKDQVNKFRYSVGILGTTIHNEVLQIGGNSGVDSVLVGGYLSNGLPVTRSKVGLPIGSFYGFKTNGIFQTQEELDSYPHLHDAEVGDLRFEDLNNDGIIDGRDRTFIGSPIPKFIFGFNVELAYLNFDFSFNIQGQTGNKIFNGKEVVRPDPYNFEQHVMDRWTGPGTSTTEPKASFGGYNYNISDKFIQDGSFVRIRNVILGYTFPVAWSSKIYMQKLRLYIKVDNLYTFTKYTGYTPEIGSADVLSTGIDTGLYPITAVYSVGLNLTF